MFPDQAPDHSQSNDPQDNLNSHNLPERSSSRSQWELTDCQPVSLQVDGVSLEAFQQIMRRLFPEVPSSLAHYFYKVSETGETIDANETLDSYFSDQHIEVSQSSTFILEDQKCFQVEHSVRMLRLDDEGPLPIELSAREPGESGINVRIVFAWLKDDAPWARVDEIGAILGRPDISELFLKASPEQSSLLPSGVVATSLTPSISLQAVTPESPADAPPVEPDLPRRGKWAPHSVQCASTLYSERNEILSAVMPEHAREIIDSGVLNTAENFADNHSLLALHRLVRAATKLSLPIQLDFNRWVCLGEPVEEADEQTSSDNQDDGDAPDSERTEQAEREPSTDQGDDELLEEVKEPEATTSSEEDDDGIESDDDDESSVNDELTADAGDAARDKVIESSVSIQGIPSALGECTLTYRTHAATLGGTILVHDNSFDLSAHTLGIEFEGEGQTPPGRAMQQRWRLIERLGDILNTPVHSASIKRTLSHFNNHPTSLRHGIDLALGRLTIFVHK